MASYQLKRDSQKTLIFAIKNVNMHQAPIPSCKWWEKARTRCLTRKRDEGPQTHLDQSQHLVLHDGGRVVFGRDDLNQHTVDEIPVGHKDVEAVAAVLHTGLQHLTWGGKAKSYHLGNSAQGTGGRA